MWSTVLVVMFSAACDAGEQYRGRVVTIIDGDSLVVEQGGEKKTIRLYGVDSPEWDQPFAMLAKKYLERTALNQNVIVNPLDKDRYKRSIALVYLHNMSLNKELVVRGYAWVHRYYCKKKVCHEWRLLEKKARKNKRGLWQEENPTPPWKWKRR